MIKRLLKLEIANVKWASLDQWPPSLQLSDFRPISNHPTLNNSYTVCVCHCPLMKSEAIFWLKPAARAKFFQTLDCTGSLCGPQYVVPLIIMDPSRNILPSVLYEMSQLTGATSNEGSFASFSPHPHSSHCSIDTPVRSFIPSTLQLVR